MIYNGFHDINLSALGFGTMRLPTENGEINESLFNEMIDYAVAHGVNYFDTAYPYHNGMSEIALGKALAEYPRDSYYLATKYPGHQISDTYNPAEVFEHQLRKCGVDFFDFYLLHNVYENSIDVYLDERWGIVDYFIEQKRLGRIRHLGFSTHGRVDLLQRFLDITGDKMDFCQIQLNWMDWTLQDARTKVEILNRHNIPIWVMEPVRGGSLCRLPEADEALLKSLRPNESIAAWGFHFLQDIKGVTMILSGMSDMTQMTENIRTFEKAVPLSQSEKYTLLEIAERIKTSVPCTACRYCTSECPMGLDIPVLIDIYNEISYSATTNAIMLLDALPEDKQPSACRSCGRCSKLCPQLIEIPKVMNALSQKLHTIPKWKDICIERDKIAKAMLKQN